MKGKITKDILLRVGQGVMRIPRDRDESNPPKPTTTKRLREKTPKKDIR